MEDPITAIRNAGYTNLVSQFIGDSAYSYVFDGQSGYLDHALATGTLTTQVTGVVEHHINADEPIVLDYNTEFKTPGQLVSLYSANKFRASDHDPVVVGLNLNHDPVANDLTVVTNEDTAVDDLLTASDLDGDPLTFALGSGPAHGTLVIRGDHTFTYTPFTNYNGPDSFTFTVTDGHGGSDTATVSITVNPINDNPVANDQMLTMDGNTTLNGTVTASDVDGDTLTFAVDLAPAVGTLLFDPVAHTFSYTPPLGFQGIASFVFSVSDGHGGWDNATVTIQVIEPNVFPVANDQSLSVNEDAVLNGTLTASDVDSAVLTYTQATAPVHGTLLIDSASGAFTYTPAANWNGSDSFTFNASDGYLSDTGTVTITVNP
ncbi:tandem-95 repeat protein, partial [bacterium]|nr:tandem-95 repeat protein [bacterium]